MSLPLLLWRKGWGEEALYMLPQPRPRDLLCGVKGMNHESLEVCCASHISAFGIRTSFEFRNSVFGFPSIRPFLFPTIHATRVGHDQHPPPSVLHFRLAGSCFPPMPRTNQCAQWTDPLRAPSAA